MTRAILTFMLLAILLSGTAVADEPTLYTCERPGGELAFQDKSGPGCEPYEYRSGFGIGAHNPFTSGWPEYGAPLVIQKGPPSVVTADPEACALYREWLTLNERTKGGTQNQSTTDRSRYQYLQRLFVATTPPLCATE